MIRHWLFGDQVKEANTYSWYSTDLDTYGRTFWITYMGFYPWNHRKIRESLTVQVTDVLLLSYGSRDDRYSYLTLWLKQSMLDDIG